MTERKLSLFFFHKLALVNARNFLKPCNSTWTYAPRRQRRSDAVLSMSKYIVLKPNILSTRFYFQKKITFSLRSPSTTYSDDKRVTRAARHSSAATPEDCRLNIQISTAPISRHWVHIATYHEKKKKQAITQIPVMISSSSHATKAMSKRKILSLLTWSQ